MDETNKNENLNEETKDLNLNEVNLLEFKINGMEKNYLKILSDLNKRINILEDKFEQIKISNDLINNKIDDNFIDIEKINNRLNDIELVIDNDNILGD